MNNNLWQLAGPVYSVVTPFEESRDIDWRALEQYLGQVVEQSPAAVYAMAYNSRYAQLTNSEIRELNKFVVEVVKGFDDRTPVIVADPITCSTAESIEFTNHAREIGADAISLLFAEKFYSLEQVRSHFVAIGRECRFPILVHEMPLTAGRGGAQIHWPLEVLEAVMSLDFVIGMKEDAKSPDLTKSILEQFSATHSVVLSGGGKRQFLSHRDDGAKSWLNGVGVWAPPVAVNFWSAIQAGDSVYVDRVIDEVERPFFDGPVKSHGWHPSCRAALTVMGLSQPYERLPMEEPSEELLNWVASIIGEIDQEMLERRRLN